MNTRGRLILGLILGTIMAERVAYFSERTLLPLALSAQGEPTVAVGKAVLIAQAVSFVGWIVGGFATYLLGPRRVLAIGVGIAALGHAALAGGLALVPGSSIVALGSGVLAPCGVLAGAEVLVWEGSDAPPSPHDFSAVAAFAIASACAANVGGFLGPVLAGGLGARLGSFAPGIVNVVLAIVALALAAAIVWVGAERSDAPPERPAVGPYRAPVPESASPPSPSRLPLAGLAMLMALKLAQTMGTVASTSLSGSLSSTDRLWIVLIQPGALFVASLVALVLLWTAAHARSSLPPLFHYGVGALIFTIGATLAAANVEHAAALFVASSAFLGAGAAVANTVPIAYAALALRGRAAVFVVIGWGVIERLVLGVVNAVSVIGSAELPLLVIAALVNLGAGLLLVTGARSLHNDRFGAP